MKVKFIFCALFVTLCVRGGHAFELRGTVPVNITSDTASVAKNIAFSEATRQIVMDSLRQYTDYVSLADLVANTPVADLSDLVTETSIDGELVSNTSYAANISMVLSIPATRQWLIENNVPQWLPDENKQDVFAVIVSMSDKLANWAELNDVARRANIDINTKFLYGNKAHFEIPTAMRRQFTTALFEAGWFYSDKDGILRIWK
ncbi:MAG: hypothetical protein R8N24_01595 [Alphaproteobacteria bacterium]|nr:hypothetical protein [Alphaproteobacteria bacterium]